ncbi:MAG: ATPase domain-containing protein, partial [Nitrososphaeraceae archaeon]
MKRISTGVPGLDSLIEGGIPKGNTAMIVGNPGTGKTILCSHFVYEGLTTKDENALYISFSESKTQFYANTERFGMDFEKFERQNKFTFLGLASFTKDGIQDTLEEILATIRNTKAKRVVLDSFSAISLAFEDKSEARTTVQVLLGKIMRSEEVTTVLIIEIPYGSNNIGSGIEESVADGIIQLEQVEDNASPIILRVLKMRCTAINREPHICTIGKNGMKLYPKQRLKLTYRAVEERITSGIPGFDERIGNGLIRGTTTAIIGAAGTAKSTFSFQFISEGIRKDEPGIYCTLEQPADEIRVMGKGYGYNMAELEKKGLSIFVKNAEDENPDEFIANLADEIKRTKAKRLVIDSISSFKHKYNNELHTITKRILSLIQEYQITTVLTILTTQKSGFEITEEDLFSLLQNIIVLRFVEVQGRMKRVLLVLKTRGSQHDNSILEFNISKDKGGAEITGPIDKEYIGILTGIA